MTLAALAGAFIGGAVGSVIVFLLFVSSRDFWR